MTWPVAKSAVDLLLSSIDDEKLLSCYGGEPLLQYPLLKDVVQYARSIEKENHKRLTIACCTNSLLLTDEHLEFFKKHDVRIHISLFGQEQDNDCYRARGHKKVLENLTKSAKFLGHTQTAACVCTTPKTVHHYREDVRSVCQKTGVRVLTIEPIIELEAWSFDNVKVFIEQVDLICQDVLQSITTRSPLFLSALSLRLSQGETRRQKVSSQKGYDQCPFLGSVEVSPSGDIAFSPFALYGKKEKRGVIGNVQEVQGAWWESCTFKRESSTCLDCYDKHYSFGGLSDKSHYLLSYMDALIDHTARSIVALAQSNPKYASYVQEAKFYAR
jgi:sulfatase maturation enzyme AslB (radical SAM superfamily)